MALIQQCAPRHVMLVHGEPSKMEFLSNKVCCCSVASPHGSASPPPPLSKSRHPKGSPANMAVAFLPQISKTFKVRVFMPPNGSAITMRTSGAVPVSVSRRLVTEALRGHHKGQREARGDHMATVAARCFHRFD